MINDLVVTFSSRKVFNDYKDEINPESFNVILEKGYEKMMLRHKDLFFVPGDGENGQVLRRGDGYIYWSDLNNVYNHTGITNVSTVYSTQIIKLGDIDYRHTNELKFLGDFVKGQEITLYITKDTDKPYGMVINLNNSIVSFTGEYSFTVAEDNKWLKLKFIYDGTTIYCESTEL